MNVFQSNICLLAVTLCWSTEVIIFAVIPSDVSSFAVTCITSLAGAAILFACFFRRVIAEVRSSRAKVLKRCAALAVLNCAYNIMNISGLSYFDVTSGAVTLTMIAVILPVILLVLRRGVDKRTWVSVALIAVGIACALVGNIQAPQVTGLALMICSGLVRAFYIVKLNDWAREHDPLAVSTLVSGCAGTLAFGLWFATSPALFTAINWTGETVASLAIYSYFIVAFAATVNVFAQRGASPVTASVIYATELVFSVAWAVIAPAGLFDAVAITPQLLVGCAFIVAGNISQTVDIPALLCGKLGASKERVAETDAGSVAESVAEDGVGVSAEIAAERIAEIAAKAAAESSPLASAKAGIGANAGTVEAVLSAECAESDVRTSRDAEPDRDASGPSRSALQADARESVRPEDAQRDVRQGALPASSLGGRFVRGFGLAIVLVAVYLAVAIPFKTMEVIPGFTDIRPVAMLQPIYGIFFGVPGCLAFAAGNFITDCLSDSLRWSSLAGFAGNFAYAFILHLFWTRVSRVPFHLDRPVMLAKHAALIVLCATVQMAIIAPAVWFHYPDVDVFLFAVSVVGNHSAFPILFGIPLVILLQDELGFAPRPLADSIERG